MRTKILGSVAAVTFGLLSGSLLANEANMNEVNVKGMAQLTPVVSITALTADQAERIAALREAQRQEREQLEADYAELIDSVMQENASKQS